MSKRTHMIVKKITVSPFGKPTIKVKYNRKNLKKYEGRILYFLDKNGNIVN